MRHYTKRFKKAVVRKVLSPGVILAEVGEKLNVHRSTIRQWKKQYQEELQSEILQEETKLLEMIQPADEEPLVQSNGSRMPKRHGLCLPSAVHPDSSEPGETGDKYYFIIKSIKTFLISNRMLHFVNR